MAGLLAWAADVVGGASESNDEEDAADSIPIIFTPDQQRYALELDHKSASLTRAIQDLRLRLPPPDIAQRLPHLHAHSLASNAALALQLNAHSSTRQQAQLREVTLQEENDAHIKAIAHCENKIQEKLQEAQLLRKKLEELDVAEASLIDKLENAQRAKQLRQSDQSSVTPKATTEVEVAKDASESDLNEKLESKKKELQLMEEKVQNLEKKWTLVQENALKQPSPAQREKILDKQLHSLIEQLEGKQAQAEGLMGEIHSKETELERLTGIAKTLQTGALDGSLARNRMSRNNSMRGGSTSSDYIVDAHHRSPYISTRAQNQEKFMLLRSGFVLYILFLHILVFIKISLW